MNTLTILPGHARDGTPETFEALSLKPGEILAVVGNTGSGKSRLIKDIEQLVGRDSVTGRLILLDGARIAPANRLLVSDRLVAHLSQNMRFVLDVTVAEFLRLHCLCRDKAANLPASVIALANTITPEPILPGNSLNLLSGGQSRALMIADIAMVCDSPIVLIDELENAGIDKKRAFGLLADSGKLILIVTHDPHTALMASRRIILEGGAIVRILERSKEEVLLSGEGKTYVIDELDRCLHPSLTYKFVDTFLKLAEQKHIQLIVTTHESRLMDFDLLRRDEIWFVNKRKSGESDIYSLEEYNARFDQKIDKAYLEGRYGGVPVFSTVLPIREG